MSDDAPKKRSWIKIHLSTACVCIFVTAASGCCRQTGRPQTVPEDRISCSIYSLGAEPVLEFAFYRDRTTSVRARFRNEKWGPRTKPHRSANECDEAWEDAAETHRLVKEGSYFYNDYDHKLEIRINGVSKTFILTKKESDKEPPKSLHRIGKFMSATVKW